MCKCDYGQCNAGVTGNCSCRCHIGPSADVVAAVKAERQWWRDNLFKLECPCKSKKHSDVCIRRVIRNLVATRPI